MKTDREFLELAAKAAGIEIAEWYEAANAFLHVGHKSPWWNPLTDDGDAFRLAVKLGISIVPGTYKVVCEFVPQEDGQCLFGKETYGDDPYAATRRAIVRAAAEIGSQS